MNEYLHSETEVENTEAANDVQHEAEANNVEQEVATNIRKSVRATKSIPPARFKSNKVISEVFEPKAVSCENNTKWKEVIQDEMNSLMENGTWELTELPQGRKAVTCLMRQTVHTQIC